MPAVILNLANKCWWVINFHASASLTPENLRHPLNMSLTRFQSQCGGCSYPFFGVNIISMPFGTHTFVWAPSCFSPFLNNWPSLIFVAHFLVPKAPNGRLQWPRCLRRTSAAARLLRLWVRIPPGAWMSVCCECCTLPGRGLCDDLITRPEKSYQLWCDLETSWKKRPWPTGSCCATRK